MPPSDLPDTPCLLDCTDAPTCYLMCGAEPGMQGAQRVAVYDRLPPHQDYPHIQPSQCGPDPLGLDVWVQQAYRMSPYIVGYAVAIGLVFALCRKLYLMWRELRELRLLARERRIMASTPFMYRSAPPREEL